MIRKALYLFVILFCFHALSSDAEDKQTLQSLVDKAAAAVEAKGKDFFPELRKQGGDWWKGELYIFVDGMDGTILVHPPNTKIEGQNLLKDPASKTIASLMIEKATPEGAWVDYMWPKPGETTPSKKMSYIKKVKMPDDQVVVVGAGMYEK